MKILVYGANGAQIGPGARALMEGGHHLRIFTRRAANAVTWADAGAEIFEGDMADKDALSRANEGCEAVFLLVPTVRNSAEEGVAFGVGAVRAAKGAGVGRVIWNTSGPVAPAGSEQAETDAGAHVLHELRASGLPFLGIQPTLYMENLMGPWTAQPLSGGDTLYYPLPRGFKVRFVAARDFGVLAAAALALPELPNEIVNLGGPEALTGEDLAARFSAALGRKIRFETLPVSEFRAQLEPLAGPLVTAIVGGLYQAIADAPDQLQPAFVPDPGSITKRFGVTLTSLEEWARQNAGAFGPTAA